MGQAREDFRPILSVPPMNRDRREQSPISD